MRQLEKGLIYNKNLVYIARVQTIVETQARKRTFSVIYCLHTVSVENTPDIRSAQIHLFLQKGIVWVMNGVVSKKC